MTFSLVLAPSPALVLQAAAMGVQGAPGQQGPQGPQGIQGPQGPQGPAGQNAVMAWQSVDLAADLALPNSNVWVQALQLVLPAGTWLLTGLTTFIRNTNLTVMYHARLTAGAAVLSSGQQFKSATIGAAAHMTLQGIVNLAAETTCRLEVATNAGNASQLLTASTPGMPSGNNATKLLAIRLA